MNGKYNWQKIGERITQEREEKGLTGTELSKIIGMTRQTLAKLERGEKVEIHLQPLLNLCNVFGCELGYLLCEFDCKTRRSADISKYTGLSDKSINILHQLTKEKFMNVFDDIDAINTVIENCKESNVLDWIAEIMCDHTEEFYGIGRAVHREMDIQTAKRILSEDGRVSLTKSDYRDYCIYIASKEFSELLYKITEQED